MRRSATLALGGCGLLLLALSARLLVGGARAQLEPVPVCVAADACSPTRVAPEQFRIELPQLAALPCGSEPAFDAAAFARAHSDSAFSALESEAVTLAEELESRRRDALLERFASGATEVEPADGFVENGRIHALRERELPDGQRVRERAELAPDEEPWIYRAAAELQRLQNEIRQQRAH